MKNRNILKILFGFIFILAAANIYGELMESIDWPEALSNDFFRHGGWRNLSEGQINNLSNLGRILFLEETPLPIQNLSVPYKILIWKHGKALSKRHIRNESNLFQDCSVQNCILTYNDSDIETADLVVIHLQLTKNVHELPKRISRSQIWAFLTDESPRNTFLNSVNNTVGMYNNIFNWSMSYRIISDIPVPYGRIISLDFQADKINIVEWSSTKKQDVLVAALISHCTHNRTTYIEELNKTVKVDFYGRCGNLKYIKCDGHFHKDCPILSKYKFYLSFENSFCEEYLTEKIWWNAYRKNAIPIVMGPSEWSLKQILPFDSYIDVNDFSSPTHLGNFLLTLNNSLDKLEQFFEWKRYFKVLNEHGYFQSRSVHYCRMCEALNYNTKEIKIYRRILFLEETPPPINNKQVPYQILIWQYGNALSRRHIRNKSNPFQGCSVQNCILTYDSKDVETADLVVIHLQRTSNLNELPVRTKTSQIWGFIADESPPHTFNYAPKEGHALFNNVFNWSINYKMISDVPVPYGRAISLQHQTDKINIVQWNDGKKQDVIVAVLMSHCIQKRTNYVKELNKTIKVDFYGNCGNLRCDGRYWTDCAILSQYKFYLSFENSYCDEYLTEKLWWNGYSKNAIPIVMGPSKSSLNQVLPANSYIDVNDFSSPRHLGEFLLNLNSSLRELEKFFEWKRNFQINKLSNLGRILFLEETPPPVKYLSKPYQILIWKFGERLSSHFIRNKSNPFQDCSVQNCILTYDDKDIETADLVVIHLQRTQNVDELPVRTKKSQIWAFLADESPMHTFIDPPRMRHAKFDHIFNWSINYKMVSDVPVPYGRAIYFEQKIDKIDIVEWNNGKKQDVIVAAMISDCTQKRLKYIKELNKTVKVDFYGKCGNLKCNKRLWEDCTLLSKYKFYLSFENSYCDEYISEKVWWNAYEKKAVPVVMGPSKSSMNQILPPGSYIDVNDFPSPSHLGKFLLKLNNSLRELEKLFEWKRNFKILNDHGYFQSKPVHYCRICEALNYNSKEPKVYEHLLNYLNLSECRP
ncbi:hypothetical protein FQR65_LT13858 [Abscondita terminalis]|nr:hypothetical protein FQR65_LT13858 [Abscondita terminalis]